MTIEEGCGGFCVYWPDKPLGERLQGWYVTRLEAVDAAVHGDRWLQAHPTAPDAPKTSEQQSQGDHLPADAPAEARHCSLCARRWLEVRTA